MACVGGGWPGSRAADGGAGGGVWLEEQLLCVCAGGVVIVQIQYLYML